ncbi:sulfur oxidation c-type cytochrome SoxX [Aquamicrobium sp. NLF2-7]|uniref:sulfur oxidation c-type cytochrome SoxX n=1 Tax=Aquamicrobium sp. NLF2-7 TaxID=2918753 RepID=UPI001EFBA0CB|nr:sulfur oxidation c-type cytochrome SoxX [Aquamicrobium sp. NLF2-7]MCG8272617.1 sulfur oxidation c-type cytochrome SoxX [Aquamicrobium sp. NLF2-7]
MRRTLIAIAAVAVCAVAGMARAGEIAPADVAFEDMAVATSLTGAPGNPEEGAKALANRGLGNCLACHAVSALTKEQFHGDVAPALDGVADRWSPEELRAIVVDAKQVFSDETMMPGFYSLNLGKDVRKDLVGKTILTAQQVEDVVAYLATLKE